MTESPIVAGIDPDSKSVTICLVQNDTHVFYQVKAKGRRAEDRIESLWRGTRQLLGSDLHVIRCQWAAVEEPMIGVNARAALMQMQAIGAVRACLFEVEIAHALVSVGVWKRAVIGNGNATKEEIKRWALAHGVKDGLSQDHYDAYAIAKWAQRGFTDG